MSKLGPIEYPDAYLSSVWAKVAYYGCLGGSASLYLAAMASPKFSILLLSQSMGLTWLAKRCAIQANRKSSFVNRWNVIANDRFEDRMFQKMETNTPTETLEPQKEKPPINLPKLLAGKLKSSLILGAPRAGKGYVAAKALQLLDAGVDVWLVDPKDDPSEHYYWVTIPDSQRLHFDAISAEPDDVIERVNLFVKQFFNAPSTADSPKLLIIDEASPGLSTCGKKWFSELMLKCSRLASIGPSKGAFVWILSQSGTGDDLGVSNANRGGFRVVAVANKDTSNAWFDSINRSLQLGPKPNELFERNYYVQNDGDGWGRCEPIELVTNWLPTGYGNPSVTSPVTAVTIDTSHVTDLPSYLDNGVLAAIVLAMSNGSSMSKAIKDNGCGGRNFNEVSGILRSNFGYLFSDS